MEPWNVVVTCRRNAERAALRELRYFGRFRPTGFRDVLIGQIDDRALVFEELGRSKDLRDPIWRAVQRFIPVDVTILFTLKTFRARLGEAIDAIAPRVPPGPFYVRIERRGHKGEIPTPEVEREMDGRIIAAHQAAGRASRVDFKEFGAVVAVETFRDIAGIGVISREEMEKYPFLRVP